MKFAAAAAAAAVHVLHQNLVLEVLWVQLPDGWKVVAARHVHHECFLKTDAAAVAAARANAAAFVVAAVPSHRLLAVYLHTHLQQQHLAGTLLLSKR